MLSYLHGFKFMVRTIRSNNFDERMLNCADKLLKKQPIYNIIIKDNLRKPVKNTCWEQYLSHIITSCQKALTILKIITCYFWASPEALLIEYKSNIRSKLEYGCQFLENIP